MLCSSLSYKNIFEVTTLYALVTIFLIYNNTEESSHIRGTSNFRLDSLIALVPGLMIREAEYPPVLCSTISNC